MKTNIVHKDKFGRIITLDGFVCYPSRNNLIIGKITKINPKMITVSDVLTTCSALKYPTDLVLIDGKDVTFYILKNSRK